jgi:CDP-diacylglycerol--serine O-phosphatidyltransferase
MKKHVPNIFTCLNLFSGCIAVVMIFRGRLETASFLVIGAVIFDFFDGLSARMLKAHSPIGKELDSLADVISFGLVPGAIMYSLFKQSNPALIYANENFLRVFQFFPFIVTVFSALRLAKFNVDVRQAESFIGLPTPANTMVIISFPLILNHDQFHLTGLILNPYFLVITSVVLSYLLVAEIPLFALKFKSFAWKNNKNQYVLLIAFIILFVLFNYVAIPLVIFLYLLLSIFNNMNEAMKRKRTSNNIIQPK